MQYTTYVLQHNTCLTHFAGNKLPNQLSTEYNNIINQYAAQGWKLLGVHPMTTKIEVGCIAKLFRLMFLQRTYDEVQVDVLIFFHE